MLIIPASFNITRTVHRHYAAKVNHSVMCICWVSGSGAGLSEAATQYGCWPGEAIRGESGQSGWGHPGHQCSSAKTQRGWSVSYQSVSLWFVQVYLCLQQLSVGFFFSTSSALLCLYFICTIFVFGPCILFFYFLFFFAFLISFAWKAQTLITVWQSASQFHFF